MEIAIQRCTGLLALAPPLGWDVGSWTRTNSTGSSICSDNRRHELAVIRLPALPFPPHFKRVDSSAGNEAYS